MIRKRSVGMAALAGWVVWACALPENAPPPTGGDGGSSQGGTSTGGSGGAGPTGGTATGGTATGGTATGGTATGGTATGGTATGGATTGGTTTGGTGGSAAGQGGTAAGQGGTAAGTGGKGGTGGQGGTAAGQGGTAAGTGGKGGTGGSSAGQGGTVGGGGASGGKGGTGGSGGSPPTVCSCLVHRYSFSGTGTTATDSIGTAHGTISAGTQSGGVVTLTGGTSNQYVSLPTGILGGLTNATFEAWVTWTGGTANWQRIFDFGSNDGGGADGDQGTTNTNASYFFLTPRAQATTSSANCMGAANFPRVAITGAGPSMETCSVSTAAFPTGMTHVAVTIGSSMVLYVNGSSVATSTPAVNLAGITDTNNFLGRSQFAADQEFAGSISEFRIYNTARTASQIAASNTAGPDTPPTQ